MTKTAVITIRVNPDVKEEVESLYNSFGITITDAVNMFIHQSLNVGGLPFDLKQPRYNKETEEAFEEARKIISGEIKAKTYHNYEDLMKDVDSE